MIDKKQLNHDTGSQEGSILATAMLVLLVLTLLGTIALNTANIEINIAANQQQWEKNFSISEGGTMIQGSGVGYAGVNGSFSWYELPDPITHHQVLVPADMNDYDPSNDDLPQGFEIPPDDRLLEDPDLWPRQNLSGNNNDDRYDYAYLVTYLYPESSSDAGPKGYGLSSTDFYLFRINGHRKVMIEMGGKKVGVKNPLGF